MRVLLALCLTGCMDYALNGDADDEQAPEPAPEQALQGSDSGVAGGTDTGLHDGGTGGTGGTGGSDGSDGTDGSGGTEPDPEPGESRDFPRIPAPGEVVIHELMIDPDAVDDAEGEWVELRNTTSAWIDLRGFRLADEGVDDYTLVETSSASLVVAPGGLVMLCANENATHNGGVTCQAEFFYQTWGGGFALANSGDEVLLIDPSGATMDRFAYGSGFAVRGSSLGVDPRAATATANDDASSWCDQWTLLASGDWGTPGANNDSCW